MNKILKILFLGFIIWAIPFFSSFFIWDMTKNAPSISLDWFNAVMSFAWAVGFGLAAFFYFGGVRKNSVKEGWIAGIIWYLEMLILDLIILVGLFNMSIIQYSPMLLTYLNTILLSVVIGYIRK